MDRLTIQIERSLRERMSEFDVDWSQICQHAVKIELERLENEPNINNIDNLIDIDVVYNNSEVDKFNIPNFPREVYKIFKKGRCIPAG